MPNRGFRLDDLYFESPSGMPWYRWQQNGLAVTLFNEAGGGDPWKQASFQITANGAATLRYLSTFLQCRQVAGDVVSAEPTMAVPVPTQTPPADMSVTISGAEITPNPVRKGGQYTLRFSLHSSSGRDIRCTVRCDGRITARTGGRTVSPGREGDPADLGAFDASSGTWAILTVSLNPNIWGSETDRSLSCRIHAFSGAGMFSQPAEKTVYARVVE
jgi:hypothetical protein